jgi:hypothetical protein
MNNEYKDEKTLHDTLKLTEKFNETFFKNTRKSIKISPFTIIKDDIKNYRKLTHEQLVELENFSHEDKLEIIKIYNIMFASIENLIN